jgi:hypothetical protein
MQAPHAMQTLRRASLPVLHSPLPPAGKSGDFVNCRHPDRDFPKMVCGYPLPCPYHTVIINADAKPVVTLTIPVTSDAAQSMTVRDRLASIGIVVQRAPKRRCRP